jgi:hypothetical protein
VLRRSKKNVSTPACLAEPHGKRLLPRWWSRALLRPSDLDLQGRNLSIALFHDPREIDRQRRSPSVLSVLRKALRGPRPPFPPGQHSKAPGFYEIVCKPSGASFVLSPAARVGTPHPYIGGSVTRSFVNQRKPLLAALNAVTFGRDSTKAACCSGIEFRPVSPVTQAKPFHSSTAEPKRASIAANPATRGERSKPSHGGKPNTFPGKFYPGHLQPLTGKLHSRPSGSFPALGY